MWNWKLFYEDKDFVFYLDIDSINDPMEDGDGIYSSPECLKTIPKRVALWVSVFIKNLELVRRYLDLRESLSLPVQGYERFNNFMCVVEIDSQNNTYRATATSDFDSEGHEIGISRVFEDKGRALFRGRIRDDWTPIIPGKTHRSILKLFRFIYGCVTDDDVSYG
ncbi:MAG: hypothetical protein N2745_08380 [Syntrophorhabdaceae bacterium]|nr:hypothetical protein [Syntrophorhabdaceae bacterium]